MSITVNARFSEMTPQELAGSFHELENPTPPEPVLFYEKTAIDAILSESEALVAKVKSTITDTDAKCAAVDRNLRADIVEEKIREIRTAAEEKVEALVVKIRQNAELAATQEKFYTRNACMQRASFAADDAKDATIRLSWSTRLAKLSSVSLKTIAEYAAANNELALACCIAEELEAREDLPELHGKKPSRGTRNEIATLFETIANPSENMLRTLYAIKLAASEVKAVTSKTYSAINRISLGLQQAGMK
jgi:hypothetical protein